MWGVFFGVLGFGLGEGERDLVIPIVSNMTWGYDNPLVIAPGHGTHYWNNEISPLPSPTKPPIPQRTPHILV